MFALVPDFAFLEDFLTGESNTTSIDELGSAIFPASLS